MLNLCLRFNESQPIYAYKPYAYQEKKCSCKLVCCVKSVRIQSGPEKLRPEKYGQEKLRIRTLFK